MSINVAKCTLFLSLRASRITSFLLLTFSSCHAGIVSSFFHSLSIAAFCTPNFHCMRHRNKLVNPIVMGHRIFVFCGWRRFHSLPCGFMRFHSSTRNSFLEPFGMQLPPQPLSCCQLRAFLLHFMAATGLSTFLLGFFESFFVILVIRINGSKCLPVVEHVSSFGFSFFHSCFSRL